MGGWVLDLLAPNPTLTLNPTQGRDGGGRGGNSFTPPGVAIVQFKHIHSFGKRSVLKGDFGLSDAKSLEPTAKGGSSFF